MGSAIEQFKNRVGLGLDAVHNQQAVHRMEQGANRAFGNPKSKTARIQRRREREEKTKRQKLEIAQGGISPRENSGMHYAEGTIVEDIGDSIDESLSKIRIGIDV